MTLASLSINLSDTFQVQASNPIPGLPSGYSVSPTINQGVQLGTAVPNNVAGGADSLVFEIVTLAGSASTTINLSAAVGILNDAVALLRVKLVRLKLLGANETAPDNTTKGTACTGVTVGGGTDPFLIANGSTTITLNGSGGIGDAIQNESGGATGIVITPATNNNIKIVNNDAVNSAKLVVIVAGGSN